jgi:Phospholipid N-methyltransferase
MAAQINPHRSGTVVELGGGTGVVTRALQAAGVAPDNLIILERDRTLHQLLTECFPRIRVLRGDAEHLNELLRGENIQSVSAIVSSLPLLSIPHHSQQAILTQSFELMDGDGVFVQYTYGRASPISEPLLHLLGIKGHPTARIWLNLPPATVWCFVASSTPLDPATLAAAKA